MNPLTDLIPARYRQYVYALATVAAFLYGLWQVSEGDWKQFGAAVAAALIGGLATSNTRSEPKLDEGNYIDGHGDEF